MWPEIYYDSRNIIHVMTHDCISFPGPSSSAGKLMRVCTSIVTASNGFLLFFSFSFWLFYFNIDVFASAMIDYVCFCVVWNFYQRYHSFPSLTLRALLSAPPTPSLIGWEAGPSILYLICLDIATPIIRKAHFLGLTTNSPYKFVWSHSLWSVREFQLPQFKRVSDMIERKWMI